MKLILPLLLSFLLIACAGGNVDREAPSFVDRSPDRPAPLPEQPPEIVNRSNDTNATIDAAKLFPGRDLVKLYVWNDYGSERIYIAEGSGAGLAKLRVHLQVVLVGESNGVREAKITLDGAPLPAMREGEEEYENGTSILVDEIILQN